MRILNTDFPNETPRIDITSRNVIVGGGGVVVHCDNEEEEEDEEDEDDTRLGDSSGLDVEMADVSTTSMNDQSSP